MNEKFFTEEEIAAGMLAYADGLLTGDPALLAAVEARLESDPAARAQMESWKAINAAIRATYAATVAEPVPPRLLAAFAPKRSRMARRAVYATSALAAALALGFIAGREVGMRMHMPEAADTAAVAAPLPSAVEPAAVQGPAGSPATETAPLDSPQLVPYQPPAALPGSPQGS